MSLIALFHPGYVPPIKHDARLRLKRLSGRPAVLTAITSHSERDRRLSSRQPWAGGEATQICHALAISMRPSPTDGGFRL